VPRPAIFQHRVDPQPAIGYQPRIVPVCGTTFRIKAKTLSRRRTAVNKEHPRMEAERKRIALCSTEDVAPGAVIKVETEGLELAVYNLDGEFYVTDDHCTHGPGSLSEGEIIGDVIECNFHGGCFNIKTGEVVEPPCVIPIRTYATEVEGGRVVITV
jgi:nitrite reductase/ring-hydroxylating ferredoxin subunit